MSFQLMTIYVMLVTCRPAEAQMKMQLQSQCRAGSASRSCMTRGQAKYHASLVCSAEAAGGRRMVAGLASGRGTAAGSGGVLMMK